LQVVLEIEQHLQLLKRQSRVRVEQWLRKLAEEVRLRARSRCVQCGPRARAPTEPCLHGQTANPVWKRNRNLHARLLLEQLRAGRLAEPFLRAPPDGPLRTPASWALAPYLSRCRWPRQDTPPSRSGACLRRRLARPAGHLPRGPNQQPALCQMSPCMRSRASRVFCPVLTLRAGHAITHLSLSRGAGRRNGWARPPAAAPACRVAPAPRSPLLLQAQGPRGPPAPARPALRAARPVAAAGLAGLQSDAPARRRQAPTPSSAAPRAAPAAAPARPTGPDLPRTGAPLLRPAPAAAAGPIATAPTAAPRPARRRARAWRRSCRRRWARASRARWTCGCGWPRRRCAMQPPCSRPAVAPACHTRGLGLRRRREAHHRRGGVCHAGAC